MFEGTGLAVKRKVAPSPANDIPEVATRITAETTRQIAANWRMQVPVQSDEKFRLEDAVKSGDDSLAARQNVPSAVRSIVAHLTRRTVYTRLSNCDVVVRPQPAFCARRRTDFPRADNAAVDRWLC